MHKKSQSGGMRAGWRADDVGTSLTKIGAQLVGQSGHQAFAAR
ncbi:hypothetical protein CES85_3641 (plasmid) [Ochrobactrum quorumnocens]|uniref:Uncharacterized protein n=1 Tax=Ochrobactrum quorumnocens TaxID=271865 RepID=A0A248UPG4_9HYPH|nr:hypothetical protein CES85_3641 [[Ochrobactrum] quorumnocens]